MKRKQLFAWMLASALAVSMCSVTWGEETAEKEEAGTVLAEQEEEAPVLDDSNRLGSQEGDTAGTEVSGDAVSDDAVSGDAASGDGEDGGSGDGDTAEDGGEGDGLIEFVSEKKKSSGRKLEDVLAEEKAAAVTSWGESLAEFRSYPVGDLSENEAKIYEFLREELKLNKAAASGVLANVLCESGFSTLAVGDGGSSFGICQWHAGRFSNLISWCNACGYDYHMLEGQLAYLKAELESGYTGVYQYLQNVPDTERGAYQAGYYWCMYFEMPGDTVRRSVERGSIAMNNYFTADLDRLKEEGLAGKKKDSQEFLDEWMLIADPNVRMQAMTDYCMYGTLKEYSALEKKETDNGESKLAMENEVMDENQIKETE